MEGWRGRYQGYLWPDYPCARGCWLDIAWTPNNLEMPRSRNHTHQTRGVTLQAIAEGQQQIPRGHHGLSFDVHQTRRERGPDRTYSRRFPAGAMAGMGLPRMDERPAIERAQCTSRT